MKQEIDWKKELLESGRFNNQFSKDLLENGAKNFMQGIYLGYMYSRWKKIRGLDKDDPLENRGQIQSSFKEFEKKTALIITWGGLRGGLSVALALNLPDDIGEGKALILFLTYVIVLFTILVQGLTLKNIVK